MLITNEKIFENGYKKEWLVTNGIGGYAMSSINGMNTRKYHALLVASVGESNERYVVLPKINEEVEVNKNSYSISTNECPNFIEKGFKFEKCFAREYLPEFFYNVHGVEIIKKISMAHGENKIAITYTIKANNNITKLKLSPLVNFRNFHEIKSMYYANQEELDGTIKIKLNSKNNLFMKVSEGTYTKYYNTYYQNMLYREEKERGFEYIESHFMPGYFEVEVRKNEEKVIEFVASLNDENEFNMKADASQIILNEETRLQKYCKIADCNSDIEKALIIAADSFIIEKSYGKTIIAGYPWFGDWGRDTFISIEGLLLKTNRFNDAKGILKTFSKYIKNGLIPNLIDEKGGQSYNSVDASLWYIDAIYKYFKYTNDKDFINDMYPNLIKIINAYKEGTDFEIKMDEDGLIIAGSKSTQLTWMDAKIDEVIPTPRYGKAVEINALWYNALCIMKIFSEIVGENFDNSLIKIVKESFKKFIPTDAQNLHHDSLYDTIDPINNQIRPNQIFATALEYPVVDADISNMIINTIEEKLLTNKGLRTLSSEDSEYKPRYEGNAFSRDLSYHQGTVWTWLYMAYVEACCKLKRPLKIEINVEELLQDKCIGNISEIYDAEEPRRANGTPAQAWSVAALITTLK